MSQPRILDNGDWMGNLGEKIADRPLNRVALPGSHDAGTWEIDWRSDLCDGRHDLPRIAEIFPCITARYSKTQNMSLYKQACLGVRYYDLRACKQDGKIWFTHGMIAGDFLKGVASLAKFARKHPKEILILDLRFIYGFHKDDYEWFAGKIMELVQDRLAVKADFTPTTLVKDYWAANKNLIFIYQGLDHKLFWSGSQIGTVWPNATEQEVSISKIKGWLDGRSESDSKLFSIQGTLTPDGWYIAKHLCGSTQLMARSLLDGPLPNLIKSYDDNRVNIVSYDVIEFPGMLEAIISRNQ